MGTLRVLAVAVMLTLASYACAQVGVEAGLTGAASGGAVGGPRGLGAAINRSVTGSAGAIGAATGRSVGAFTMGAGTGAASRSFVPGLTGRYVAGVSWSAPGTTPVVLQTGAQQATGTTAAPVLLHFEAPAGKMCNVAVRAAGQPPAGGLSGELEFVRETPPGQPLSKSLLTPEERLTEFSRRGPRPSVLPLLANLADRHLWAAQPATDLDAVFTRALAAVPGVTATELRALIRDFDATPEAVRAKFFTSRTLALRTQTAPTVAAVAPLFSRTPAGAGPTFSGAATPRVAALEPAVPAGGAYAPGATIRLVGENFAPQPDRNQVCLYPQTPGGFKTRFVSVSAATPTALLFQLPADLPDGGVRLMVTVDGKSVSQAVPLSVKQGGVNTPPGAATDRAASRYRLSCLRVVCVDESNPEWWGNDDVVALITAVGDTQVVTQARGPFRDLSDGGVQNLPAADQPLFTAMEIAEGLGVAVELWRWNPPDPAAGLGLWALRENFAHALAMPEPHFTHPKPQDDVSGELAVWADPVGFQQAVWTADELQQLLQPGQKIEKVLELRDGDKPAQYDAAGSYKLILALERLD